jgi:hypothetical protein
MLQIVKQLSVYQMIYAILLPRVGGNFVIKTLAANFDIQYLSLIYAACAKYDKLYVFHSSRNFWSHEVYLIGIGKKELQKDEIDNLLTIAKELDNGRIVYPVDFVSANFGLEYEFYIQNIIENHVEIKKFISYLARNPDVFEELKPKFTETFDIKNKLWIDKYLNLKN